MVDTSGSMSGSAYQNAKLAADYIVQSQSLDKDYFIKIYAFHDEVNLWRKEWTPMPHPEEWAKAMIFLNKFTGAGNTNMIEAVARALKENNKDEICIFLISDGDPTLSREDTLKEILKVRGKSPTVIHTIFIQEFIGREPKESREFMHKIAKKTGGNFVIIKQTAPTSEKPF